MRTLWMFIGVFLVFGKVHGGEWANIATSSNTVPGHICDVNTSQLGNYDIDCPETNPEITASGIISATGISVTGAISTTSLFVNGAPLSAVGSGVPKYTSTERDNLSPAQGDVIYNLTENRIEWFDGTDWRTSSASSTIVASGGCAGTEVGGFCWYLGNLGESCTSVCSGRGGYNEATRIYAGSDGTNANCTTVMNALGKSGSASTAIFLAGEGCVYENNQILRVPGTTTSGASNGSTERACACGD